jgi:hypothetical protein
MCSCTYLHTLKSPSCSTLNTQLSAHKRQRLSPKPRPQPLTPNSDLNEIHCLPWCVVGCRFEPLVHSIPVPVPIPVSLFPFSCLPICFCFFLCSGGSMVLCRTSESLAVFLGAYLSLSSVSRLLTLDSFFISFPPVPSFRLTTVLFVSLFNLL